MHAISKGLQINFLGSSLRSQCLLLYQPRFPRKRVRFLEDLFGDEFSISLERRGTGMGVRIEARKGTGEESQLHE